MRKGQVGGYREEMSQEMIERIDKWSAEKLNDTDLKFSEF